MKEKEMTKQEAIDTLKLYSNNRFGIVSEPFWKAINIALEALKSQSGDEPDWSKAPWANYYGIDADGSRWFYEKEPHALGSSYDQNTGDFTKDEELGRMKLLKRPEQ